MSGFDAAAWLLLAMTALWGVRLAVHIALRSRGKGEDPRYQELLAGKGALHAFVVLGVCFETIGDAQLAAFKADPDRSGVLDTGLWRFTRHPNHFGDACVWVGIFLVVAGHWPGVLTVLSPVVMVYLLAFGSGARVLERAMADRPGYRDYMRRTSGFIPLPPRRGGAARMDLSQ